MRSLWRELWTFRVAVALKMGPFPLVVYVLGLPLCTRSPHTSGPLRTDHVDDRSCRSSVRRPLSHDLIHLKHPADHHVVASIRVHDLRGFGCGFGFGRGRDPQ